MEMDNLNSFSTFVDDSTLNINEKIKRDLYNFLTSAIGSGFFSRGEGSPIVKLENTENTDFFNDVVKSQIVQAVGMYNNQVPSQFQVAVGSDMVEIAREDNGIEILVVFIPLQKPDPMNIDSFIMSLPNFGG